MFHFMDDSGDPGWVGKTGASPILALGMLSFSTGSAVEQAKDAMVRFKRDRGLSGELKFNKSRDALRHDLCVMAKDFPITCRLAWIDKARLRGRPKPAEMFRALAFGLHEADPDIFRDAKIRIDASTSPDQSEIERFFRALPGEARPKNVRREDSAHNEILQLTDMIVGVVARSLRTDRDDGKSLRAVIASRICWTKRILL